MVNDENLGYITSSIPQKPLARKNYDSIGHLPDSRMGPSDRSIHVGQARIACVKIRDRRDVVIVTEKLDGSNVGIARIGDQIVALGRAGHLAQSSKYAQHQLFADWVRRDEDRWRRFLNPDERLVGEWLAQAHGTRYSLPQGPFVAFDLMEGDERLPFAVTNDRCTSLGVPVPKLLHVGGALPVATAMELLGWGDHGAQDEPEGCVWRVERDGKFAFLAKYVRPDKADGTYLPEVSGGEVTWNWRP